MALSPPAVDRVTLTKTQQQARTTILYIMADAVNALMGADGLVYTKVQTEVPNA